MSEKISSMEICPICQQPINAHVEDCSYLAVKKEHQEWEDEAEEMTPEFRKEFSTGKRTVESQMADIEREMAEMEQLSLEKIANLPQETIEQASRIIEEDDQIDALLFSIDGALRFAYNYLRQYSKLLDVKKAEKGAEIHDKYKAFSKRWDVLRDAYTFRECKNKAEWNEVLKKLTDLSTEIHDICGQLEKEN